MILFQKRSLLLKYFKVPTNFRLVCFERREGFGQKSGDIGFQKSRLQGSPGHLLECLSEGAHWIMYEYVLDGNGQWSLGDILYLATSWIPALDGVLPPPLVVKSKDTSTYHSHSYPFHDRRL